MTKQEALELIILAKEMGLASIEAEGIKATFNTSQNLVTQNLEVPDATAEELIAPPNAIDELTDEEILFWSSPYGLELEERKSAKRTQIDEDKALNAQE